MAIAAQDDHTPYSRLVGRFIAVCGVGAALALIGVSVAMNWRFGYSLGKTPLDGMIYGTASAAADCLKAVVPFFFFGAIRRRVWSRAVAAAIVGLVVTGYSLFSAFGHAAQNRSETTGHRAVDAKAYKALGADLKRAQDQLSWIPVYRPPATVSGEIDGMKVQRQWTLTQECGAVTSKVGREFCIRYHELLAELGNGRQAAELETRIAEVQRKLERFQGTAAEQEADPQAAFLAELFGISVHQVQLGLTMFVAVLLEVGSGLGMYMALGQWREENSPVTKPVVPDAPLPANAPIASLPPPTASAAAEHNPIEPDADVVKFVDERMLRAVGRSCLVTTVYDAYLAWCEERRIEVLALPTFVRVLGELGIHRVRSGDGMVCADVEMAGV